MSFQYDLEKATPSRLPRGALPTVEGESVKSSLESFLHYAPVRCIEAVARFLDLQSFVSTLSLNSSLLQLCDSSALQPCWTHFALIQRILRHGENVLLPSLSPMSLPSLRGSEGRGAGWGRARRNGKNHADDKEVVSPCQTFSRLLPRVTRLDLVRIGSLNSNWRNKNFSSEQRQVICCGEALDKAFVLPAPPFESSFSEYSVAPDSQLDLQACPSVGVPACLQPMSTCSSVGTTPVFTVLPSSRIFAVHAAAGAQHSRSVEVKLPLLPAKIPREPDPLIKFGGHAPKGWLLGEYEVPLQATPAATVEGAEPAGRISQSARKRRQRQQRQQQAHRLHMTWVHITPHPLCSCSKSIAGEHSRSSSGEGSPSFYHPSRTTRSNKDSYVRRGGRPGVSDPGFIDGLGHCPRVNLLCLCLPPIEIEDPASVNSGVSGGGRPGESNEKNGSGTANETEQAEEDPTCRRAAAFDVVGSVKNDVAPVETPEIRKPCTKPTVTDSDDDDGGNPSEAAPVPRPAPVTLKRPQLPPTIDRVWPVALCSYSPKGLRFLAHAVVCCSLLEGETLISARSRLWYKAKRQKRALRCSASKNGSSDFGEEAQAPFVFSATAEEPSIRTQTRDLRSRTSDTKAISFSMQQHPAAVFVGMIAVGTSKGRILCTPPPRCLVRSCYCESGCFEGIKLGGLGGENENGCGTHDARSSNEARSVQSTCAKWPESCGRFVNIEQSPPECYGSPVISSSGCCPPDTTAAKAGCGVAFSEVGSFGDGGGPVDYIELVRGTPWAPCSQRQDKPQLLIPIQQRGSSWHWTRAPVAAGQRQGVVDATTEQASACSVFCGGLEAEALWLFAYSKDAGLKVFRFMWSPEGSERVGGGLAKCAEAQTACGGWRCVLTIRGNCQLISLDLNNGIISVCTPTDSKVCFLCFKHLLPAHIYLPNTTEPLVIPAKDLASFGRTGLPRPQHVPLDGFLAVPQPQFTSSLQSPPECARLELLVARRPSFLQPLGGRRWVVIDGSVIRVVKIKLKNAVDNLKPLDAAQQELLHFSLNGTPTEHLRQLRRPIVNDPELPWALKPPAAPELHAIRLCVFSHPRNIYHCAFDGVRRLVTIDLREVLMIWDLQRYTKLCELDLMASGESLSRGDPCSQEEGCNEDGGDICLSSDGPCSENETIGRSHSKKGCAGDVKVGSKLSGAKAMRKAAKLSRRKQFGSGWMEKQILAHRNSTALHTTGHSTNTFGLPGNRAAPQPEERVSVGGVWFSSSSLEPALQLQALYDIRKETADGRTLHDHKGATRQADSTGNEGTAEGKPECASADGGYTSGAGCEPFSLPCKPTKARRHLKVGSSLPTNFESLDPELSTAVSVSYASDFPPLSTEPLSMQVRENTKQHHSLSEACTTPSAQPPSLVASRSTRIASKASAGMPNTENYSQQITTASSRGISALSWALTGLSSKDEQPVQQMPRVKSSNGTKADGGGRQSFAAVVAAAASSSVGCPKTGWASSPAESSFFIDLLGEEGARALQESAAALGMSIEELYIQQVVQWEGLQQRSHQRAQVGAISKGHEERVTRSNPFPHRNGEERTAAHARPDGNTDPASDQQDVSNAARGVRRPKEACSSARTLHSSDAGSSNSCKISESRPHQEVRGAPQPSTLHGSAPTLRASLRLRPLSMSVLNNCGPRSESRMVGLLGRHNCVTRLGPNAQRRHVTALCLSETSVALLFKNLKTWQIWTFAPSDRFWAESANEPLT